MDLSHHILIFTVLVYDTIRGMRIHDHPLPPCLDKSASASLISDSKRSRLAVLFKQKDCCAVAFSTVYADNAASAQSLLGGSRLSLAVGLASSLSLRPNVLARPTNTLKWGGTLLAPPPRSVEGGVGLLEDIFEKVRRRAPAAARDSFLRDAFEQAVHVAFGANAGRDDNNPQDAIPTKVKGRINGMTSPDVKQDKSLANGHHFPAPDPSQQLKRLPQAFTDSAISLVVDILCISSTTKLDGTIINDARFLLQQLVCSGKVSARTQLVPRIDCTTSFSSFLRSLELQPTEETQGVISAFTPIDFIRQLYKHCSDVSEHQMVAIVLYVLARAKPKDIAACFGNDAVLKGGNPIFVKMARFTALETMRKRNSEDDDEMTAIGRRLIVFHLAGVMKTIMEYSTCNDSLLRDALSTLLADKEMRFMSKFLVDVLYAPEKYCFQPGPGFLRNAMQWLTALCDCLKQKSPSSEDVKYIRRSIATQLWVTGKVVSLQTSLCDTFAGSSDKSQIGEKTSSTTEKSSRNLPLYQIEHLVF